MKQASTIIQCQIPELNLVPTRKLIDIDRQELSKVSMHSTKSYKRKKLSIVSKITQTRIHFVASLARSEYVRSESEVRIIYAGREVHVSGQEGRHL